jgi:hypothetical protein
MVCADKAPAENNITAIATAVFLMNLSNIVVVFFTQQGLPE